MMSKVEARKKINDDLDHGKLLNDIDAISGILYLDKSKSSSAVGINRSKSADKANASMPNLKPKHGSDDPSLKDKKSIWKWKPLKALSQVRSRRFNCGFTLEVHTVEGLPSEFNGLSLLIHWKRRDGEVVTRPIKVVEGIAEFGEKLIHTCSVYGSRKGPRHSAKYEAKHFLLYAVVHENPKLDLGKHRVDLTRLLPLTLEELEGEKSSGTWTTSFNLLGNANGAVMNVSFGYVVLGDNVAPNNKNVLKLLESRSAGRNNTKSNPGDGNGSMQSTGSSPTNPSNTKSDSGDGNHSIQRTGSFPSNQKPSIASQSVNDVKVLCEVFPARMSEFSSSVDTLYQKFDDEMSNSVVDDKCEFATSDDDDIEPLKPASISSLDLSMGISDDENDHTEFSVIDKGIESLEEKPGLDQNGGTFVDQPLVGSPGLTVSCSCIQGDAQEEPHFIRDEGIVDDLSSKQEEMCTKESLLEDLESVLGHVTNLENEVLDSPEDRSALSDWENEVEDKPNGVVQSNLDDLAESVPSQKKAFEASEARRESSDQEIEVEDEPKGMLQSNLDDLVDSIADEFLSMLALGDSPISFGSDAEPESPRERLLREFQKEAEASGCSLFGFDIDEEVVADYEEYDAVDCNFHAPTVSCWGEFSQDSDIFSVVEPESPEIRAKVISEYPKIRAKVMEDLETEALLQEWGLDGKAFESSPPNSAGGYGSPMSPSPKEPSPLPPLGEGLGSFIKTKTGGFLRSMNPVLFSNAKSGGSLIMQVSSPVVVPAELGSGVMEILQNLASVGLERLSIQANKLMPLEEISGKTMQQIAWEAANIEASKRHDLLQDVPRVGHGICAEKKRTNGDFTDQQLKKVSSKPAADEVAAEYVSLEDLAPLAMDEIEALTIEGLRIQCDMTEEEAPSNMNARESSTLGGRRTSSTRSVGLEGAVGLQLLNVKDSGADHVDGLMGLSLTLDEWMKLDSGEIDEDEQTSESTSKLLAAHHANCTDLNLLGKKKHGKASGRRCGLLSNNFTIALMVQLHDPLRNYEPVGTAILALIQVERVFLPPKLKLYGTIAEARDSDDEEDEPESANKEATKVELKEENTQELELIPQYKINKVHVAGLKTEPGKKKLWGSAAQQQSGSRWLLANGMGKGDKYPILKSKIAAKSSSLPATIISQHGDTLWSISAQFLGNGSKWKELASLNPHVRNPNVILPNETIKLR
ncbi:hypothetical protein Cgig2_013381 [Carnegiea gigantea]|uniref:Uncharacterized protein n=1 Tax=Carnegiea gigantea TaxID=171969 RepID=A0A9Q1K8J5_9CARY|nr:hypothetical protein Cgig2_013381 [Carnegiea gigantea]